MVLFFGESSVNATRDLEILGRCGRLAHRLASVDHAVTCYNLGIRSETLPELAGALQDELPRRHCAEDDGFHPRAEDYQAMAALIWSTSAWRGLAGLAHDKERPAAEHGAVSASAAESEPGGASGERDAPRAQAIPWAIDVSERRRPALDAAHGQNGAWARLLRRAEGDRGADVLTDDTDPSRSLTIKRWRLAEDRHRLMTGRASAYRAFDGDCVALTPDEILIGTFSVETRAPVGDAWRAHDD